MAHPRALRSSLFSPLLCLLLSCPFPISPVLPPTGSLPNRVSTTPRRISWPEARSISWSAILSRKLPTTQPVTAANIQPARYPAPIPTDNPNLIRYSSHNDARSRASTVISTAASANGRSISLARWNSHYLIPRASTTTSIDSTPVASFTAPDWVLVTSQGPNSAPAPNAVIGRYAYAVYDEGGLIDVNLGGFPNYASLSRPTRPTRRLAPKYPVEESEIMLVACQAPSFTPDHFSDSITAGAPFSLTPNTNGTIRQTLHCKLSTPRFIYKSEQRKHLWHTH